jgi:prophage antirepressor-like protein
LFQSKQIRRILHNHEWWLVISDVVVVLTDPGGPQNLNCANAKGLFRLIQSIPSPKAEPFKRWLAKKSPMMRSQNETNGLTDADKRYMILMDAGWKGR